MAALGCGLGFLGLCSSRAGEAPKKQQEKSNFQNRNFHCTFSESQAVTKRNQRHLWCAIKPEQHTLAAKHPRGAFHKEHCTHSWNAVMLQRDCTIFRLSFNNKTGTDNKRFGFLGFFLTSLCFSYLIFPRGVQSQTLGWKESVVNPQQQLQRCTCSSDSELHHFPSQQNPKFMCFP